MIQYVRQPKRAKQAGRRSIENYLGRYKLPGDLRITEVSLHTTDKRIAEQRLAAIVREKQDERAGIIAPKPLRDGAAKLLTQHVADFVADLKAKGRAKKYYGLLEARLLELLTACSWVYVKDMTADSFVSWRTHKGAKPKTINDYLAAVKSLLRWMKLQGRIVTPPLEGVQKVSTAGREPFRRAFTDDEFSRLRDVAGPRRAVYLMAFYTGLRRGELRALQWGDLHLDDVELFVNVRASTTKNHKRAAILLHVDVVAELQKLRPANAKGNARVFRMPNPETFQNDLAAAKIPRLDDQGRKVDLHALRYTLATNLARAGVAPRVCMEMMRHSDMKLTANVYTDAGKLPMSDALGKLPRFGVTAQADEKRSQMRSQTAVAEGQTVSQPVAVATLSTNEKSPENQGFCQGLSQSVVRDKDVSTNESDGARTRNLRIDSPVL